MKLRIAKPEYVIDIDPLAGELGYVDERADEIRIGAMTRHAALLDSPLLERQARDLHRRRARDRRPRGPQPRHDRRRALPGRPVRGPLGGLRGGRRAAGHPRPPAASASSTCTTSTAARTRPRSARPRCWSRSGSRCTPMTGSAYLKVDRRVGDWAVVAAGASLDFHADGTIARAGLGLAAVGGDITARRPGSKVKSRARRLFAQGREARPVRMRTGQRSTRIRGLQETRRRRPDGARAQARHRAGTFNEGGVTWRPHC